MNRISVECLSYAAGGRQILREVSLDIDCRLFTGLIGPNGCGKSTLLKHIYRIYAPQAGAISYDGVAYHDISLRASARKIAVVGQFHSSDFDFSVEETALMGRTPYKKSFEEDTVRDYEIAEAALEEMGMFEHRHRMVSELSGGEVQRVMLARAFVQEPEFLILDEPTNHLDITYQLRLLQSVKRSGLGVLAALHDLNLAAMFCDRIIVMKDGRIEGVGSPGDVLTEDMLERVYGVRSRITDDGNGRPHIAYIPDGAFP